MLAKISVDEFSWLLSSGTIVGWTSVTVLVGSITWISELVSILKVVMIAFVVVLEIFWVFSTGEDVRSSLGFSDPWGLLDDVGCVNSKWFSRGITGLAVFWEGVCLDCRLSSWPLWFGKGIGRGFEPSTKVFSLTILSPFKGGWYFCDFFVVCSGSFWIGSDVTLDSFWGFGSLGIAVELEGLEGRLGFSELLGGVEDFWGGWWEVSSSVDSWSKKLGSWVGNGL